MNQSQGPYGGYPPPYAQQQPYYPQQPMMIVQQSTTIVKAPFGHGVHLVLDVLSCGMWLPVHFICWALQ